MEYIDQQITCSECGGVFTFTAGEQEFYARKGFSSPPKRCKPCREARRHHKGGGGGGGSEGVYRAPGFRDEPGGGGGGYRGPREQVSVGHQGGGASRRPLYEIVCADCGQKASVPFRPAQGKPVYCRDCYAGRKASDGFR